MARQPIPLAKGRAMRLYEGGIPRQMQGFGEGHGSAAGARLREGEFGRPPRCAQCGNMVRPAVVWFGEMLPQATFAAAEHAAGRCDAMLVVGTAGAVYPAAGLAHTAREAGARVIVVNPHPSELDEVAHHVLTGPSAVLIPQLLDF